MRLVANTAYIPLLAHRPPTPAGKRDYGKRNVRKFGFLANANHRLSGGRALVTGGYQNGKLIYPSPIFAAAKCARHYGDRTGGIGGFLLPISQFPGDQRATGWWVTASYPGRPRGRARLVAETRWTKRH